jgi:hypothetical protein
VARENDWALLEKAVDITASAVRGAFAGERAPDAKTIGDVFRETWAALKEANAELPDKGRPGF